MAMPGWGHSGQSRLSGYWKKPSMLLEMVSHKKNRVEAKEKTC